MGWKIIRLHLGSLTFQRNACMQNTKAVRQLVWILGKLHFNRGMAQKVR